MKAIYIKMSGRVHPSTNLLAKEFNITEWYDYDPPRHLRPYSTFLYAPIAARKIKNYDIYFLESLSPSPLLMWVKKKDNLTVIKGNDQSPYLMENKKIWKLTFKYLLNLNNTVDYMIAVSDMIKKYFEERFSFKIITCEGFMVRDYNKLKEISPNFELRNFIHIGHNGFFKGVDIMIKIFIKMKKKGIIRKDTKFYIVGVDQKFIDSIGYSKEYLFQHNIIIVPATDKIESYLSDSLFHFHLARYEPNAVAVMEGMASGHIPIVSFKTGNKDFISHIDKNLIIDSFSEEKIINKVSEIVNYNDEELRRLSKKFKEESYIYSKEEGLKRWKKVWEKITK